MLHFQIDGQKLDFKFLTKPIVVADSINYLQVKCIFSDDWKGYSKKIHFRKSEEVKPIDDRFHPVINQEEDDTEDPGYVFELDSDDMITADQNLSLTDGVWSVWLHGIKGDSRITTDEIKLSVKKTGSINGNVYPGVPQSVIDQVYDIVKVLDFSGTGNQFLANDGKWHEGTSAGLSDDVKNFVKEQADNALTESKNYTPEGFNARATNYMFGGFAGTKIENLEFMGDDTGSNATNDHRNMFRAAKILEADMSGFTGRIPSLNMCQNMFYQSAVRKVWIPSTWKNISCNSQGYSMMNGISNPDCIIFTDAPSMPSTWTGLWYYRTATAPVTIAWGSTHEEYEAY